jgi:hypothetical protein
VGKVKVLRSELIGADWTKIRSETARGRGFADAFRGPVFFDW